MTVALAVVGTGRMPAPITVSANWGSIAGASPQVSAARTLTVPAGNPGILRIAFTGSEGVPVRSYQLNGGSFVSVTDGLTIAVANTNTLAFRVTGGSGVEAQWDVYDNRTGTLVGSFSATIT